MATMRCVVTVLVLICLCDRASAQDYLLGIADKLRVDVFEYPRLSGEYSIGASGDIAIQSLGEVKAAGLTTKQLGAAISDKIATRDRNASQVSAAVQVAEYRPFYILGAVERPSLYAYRPGLTVVQALAIAGGVYRPADPGLLRLGRDAITEAGRISVLEDKKIQVAFRIARLEAELKGQDSIPFPALRPAQPSTETISSREKAIFESRRTLLAGQVDTLRKLQAFYQAEIESLQKQETLKTQQLENLQRELRDMRQLVAQQLAPVPRALVLEREAAETESERLELQTQTQRARQGLAQAVQSLLNTQGSRAAEVAAALAQAEAEQSEIIRQLATAKSLFEEASVLAPAAFQQRLDMNERKLKLEIVRGSSTLAVSDGDPVLPGDVVRVSFFEPPGAEARSLGQ